MKARIHIDEEEIETLIDHHKGAANDADDSCEYEEAKERRERAKALRVVLDNIRRAR